MRRHHKKNGMTLDRTQDPGKDLFAYLFLLIMVFSFMLMMSMEDRYERLIGQLAPDLQQEQKTGQTTLAVVSNTQIGTLAKSSGRLYLVFNDNSYDPETDVEKLIQENRVVVIQTKDGQIKKYLYLADTKTDQILLAEYLAAFQALSNSGISVAFAEVDRVQNQ